MDYNFHHCILNTTEREVIDKRSDKQSSFEITKDKKKKKTHLYRVSLTAGCTYLIHHHPKNNNNNEIISDKAQKHSKIALGITEQSTNLRW